MILYFSGTGNSRFTAKIIAEKTGDTLVSINDLLKKNETKAELSSLKPFVFVAPSYAARIPRVVEHFIRTARFTGNKKAYFVMTAFENIGSAGKYNKKTCKKAGLEYAGTTAILMAENYVVMYNIPSQKEAEQLAREAEPSIIQTALAIAAGKTIEPPAGSTNDKMMSNIVNPIFYPLFVHAKGFHATDSCTGCGACAVNCPLNNIHLENSRPVWNNTCTHCMACISRCPQHAIEYNNATQKRERFYIGM